MLHSANTTRCRSYRSDGEPFIYPLESSRFQKSLWRLSNKTHLNKLKKLDQIQKRNRKLQSRLKRIQWVQWYITCYTSCSSTNKCTKIWVKISHNTLHRVFRTYLSSWILKSMRELDKLIDHLTLITLRAVHFYYAYTQLSRFQKYENDKEDRYHNLFYDVIRTIWI